MIKNILITIICGIANRIRGGLRIKGHKLPLNKYWFAISFACCYCWLTEWNLNKWLIVMIATRLGSQLYGWGEYIGCVLGASKPTDDRHDCDLVDDIVDSIRFTFKGHSFKLSDYPIAWGWLGLSLRGVIWSFLIGLAIDSIPYMFSGFSMGTVYYLCGLFSRKVKPLEKGGWNVSEYVFGGILAIFLIIRIK